MFTIVLIGHGEISKGFLSAAEMIVGEQKNISALVLDAEDSFEHYLERLRGVSDGSEEVLFLADLQGGTPANAATYLVKEKDYTCLAGINLPMLLEILIARMSNSTLNETVERAQRVAFESVKLIKK